MGNKIAVTKQKEKMNGKGSYVSYRIKENDNIPIANSSQYLKPKPKLHREDGPAVEFDDGDVGFWLEGYHYLFEQWITLVDLSNEEKVMLKLKYG